jgi:hypothetical protein
MKKKFFAHVSAVPLSFPDKIELRYIEADPSDRTIIGKRGFGRANPEPWDVIRNRIVLPEDDLGKAEERLMNGMDASLGFHLVDFDLCGG